MKKIIYSVLIGEYDQINSFQKQKDFDYFLFSDKNYNNTNWTILPIPKKFLTFNLSIYKITRFIKIFPHLFFKNYELSIYIDASFNIIGDLDDLLLRILTPKYSMYSIQHPERNKIFHEFSAVLDWKKENKSIVNLVKNRYIKEKFPDNLRLTENCIIIRKHNNKQIINLMEEWWKEVKLYSYRDQLSFNYVMWKIGMKVYYIPKIFIIDYFSHRPHSLEITFNY